MVASTRTPVRTDRLRSLNRPKEVEVDVSRQPSASNLQLSQSKPPTAGGWRPEADINSFQIPRAVRQTDELKAIDAIREMWEVEDEWWRDHVARRYFDVILNGGKHLIIYQDRLTGKWFSQTP